MTYILRTEYDVIAGKFPEQQARAAALQDFLQSQPGFRGTVLVNSLGYPSRFIRAIAFEHREAAQTVMRSQAMRDFNQQRPVEGILVPTGPQEAWEEIAALVEPGTPSFAMTVDVTTDLGKAQAFEESRKDLFELRRKEARGIISSRLLRFLGSPNRYQIYTSWLGEADARAFYEISPASQAFNQQHPLTNYSSVPAVIQRYEVVMVAVPATV